MADENTSASAGGGSSSSSRSRRSSGGSRAPRAIMVFFGKDGKPTGWTSNHKVAVNHMKGGDVTLEEVIEFKE